MVAGSSGGIGGGGGWMWIPENNETKLRGVMCHVEDNHPCQLLRVCMYGTIYYDTYRTRYFW